MCRTEQTMDYSVWWLNQRFGRRQGQKLAFMTFSLSGSSFLSTVFLKWNVFFCFGVYFIVYTEISSVLNRNISTLWNYSHALCVPNSYLGVRCFTVFHLWHCSTWNQLILLLIEAHCCILVCSFSKITSE